MSRQEETRMITLAPEVAGKVRIAVVRAEPIVAAPAGPELDAEITRVCSTLAGRYAGRAPGEIPGLAPARDLYKAFGIDPTRRRPSSEALLRRILQAKPFPKILGPVDVCNLCAVEFLLPIGLYDLGKIGPAVTLRRGLAGEAYPGIRKEDVHLEGNPVLADDEGPFGNPTSDSLRASVTESTRSLWMIIFAPASYPAAALRAHGLRAEALIAGHLAPAGATTSTSSFLLPE
jgi:DNA/RNA-binding domain of Phe-tRNA-synthetase-like protein